MNRRATLGCALFLLLVVAIRFAEPVLDGDLFFHLAYGRQMLERHAGISSSPRGLPACQAPEAPLGT